MAGVVTTRLLEALADIGIDVSKKQPSNVKTLATKNKSTATKPGLLAGERDTGGNFATVLDIFKKEAQYIDGMNDVEQMAFLNNIMDYKEFGGSSIKVSEGIKLKDEFDKGLGTLTDDIESLQTTAKTMKDDAEKGLASAEKDLKDFLDTGGQPLKAKSDKYLGGSMHEEGQLRTAIRTFLKNEYKNGRIKLDKDDQFRIMEYSPMMEDDPIKVFKKIYGDEAYNKAGSFPGAFEKGEDFNHYEKIFKENMGEDLLKVKDKKYVGDGTLVLTKQEEVVTPTPDEDTPFAKGGRASFVGGKLADELIAMIITKEPMDAMKELNKIIGKKGKYKNLTQKDINRIVDQTNDHIFQRDPDNLYVEDRPMFKQKEKSVDDKKRLLTDDEIRDYEAELGDSETWMMDGTVEEAEKALKDRNEYIADMKKEYDAASPAERAEVIGTKKVNVDDMSVEDSLTTLEGLGATKMAERFKLKQRYPGISEDLLTNIIEDTDPVHKASVLAKMDQAMKLIVGEGKGTDEAIDILKSEPKTKMATGGRAGYYGGGQAMIEPDLSDIGHGSDSLMARTRITAPGSQATTSTGLNYLLGEDNDNIRVPFNEGLSVKPSDSMMVDTTTSSPDFYNTDKFEKDSMTYLKGMYGTGQDSNKFLYNEMIKKGNELRKQGVDRKTVIEIIRKNKNKIDEILRQQEFKDISPKSLAGLANGGRIGFAGGGADMSTVADSKGNVGAKSVSVSPSGSVTTSKTKGPDGPDDRSNFDQNVNHREAMRNYQKPQESVVKNIFNTGQEVNYLRNLYKMNVPGLAISYGINRFGPSIMEKLKNLRSEAEIEEEDGIMQMAELSQKQLDFLNSPKTKRDLTDNFLSPQQVFDKLPEYEEKTPLNPFKGDQEPTTPEEFNQYLDTIDKNKFLERITVANGGIAGLRQGYAGGNIVDKGRRGFLKFLGGTTAGVIALKTGLAKLLGKDSGAISKKAIDEVIIDGGSGAPAWLQPLVNKALKEGKDISQNAIVDGQVVKSLDTPTGKVDVYYNTRTGEVDIDYIGGNTALGEGVQLRYTPGIADEGTQGIKPADEFEAVENIPEGKMTGPDDYNVEFGENAVGDVKGLYSDTSELAELAGQKPIIKDVVETVKKKRILKQMNENPTEFANNNLRDDFPDYDYNE